MGDIDTRHRRSTQFSHGVFRKTKPDSCLIVGQDEYYDRRARGLPHTSQGKGFQAVARGMKRSTTIPIDLLTYTESWLWHNPASPWDNLPRYRRYWAPYQALPFLQRFGYLPLGIL